MKKVTVTLLSFLLLMAFVPGNLKAEGIAANKTSTAVESPEMKALTNRLNEIKEMDKSTLNASEKKELRTEVRTIKKDMKAASNGVYLSVGALLLVIILLIVLL